MQGTPLPPDVTDLPSCKLCVKQWLMEQCSLPITPVLVLGLNNHVMKVEPTTSCSSIGAVQAIGVAYQGRKAAPDSTRFCDRKARTTWPVSWLNNDVRHWPPPGHNRLHNSGSCQLGEIRFMQVLVSIKNPTKPKQLANKMEIRSNHSVCKLLFDWAKSA